MSDRPPLQFHYVPEMEDSFLALFPHRWDYIYADHPSPGQHPSWKTESRHPLSDRLIKQGAFLYGVRFAPTTKYFLLDIDRSSIYHPLRDRFAVAGMISALEEIGVASYIPITSSYSQGIHIYCPFEFPVKTWQIATGVQSLLENAGYRVEPGQLEVYPNTRNFDAENIPLFKAHRLPMLAPGSYLLDEDWNLCSHRTEVFTYRWQFCTSKNDIQVDALARVATEAKRKQRQITHRASKFLADLDGCINPGWSGHGQTNFLLGRIALRGYVFGELLTGAKLTGAALINHIVEVARSLPGYSDWCRHQHEIAHRAEEWATCVEASHYFPYKSKPASEAVAEEAQPPTPRYVWQSEQKDEARERIRKAIAHLLNHNSLPVGARARFFVLTHQFGIGGETLYNHRDLWHPDHLWKTPPDPPNVDRSQHEIPSDGGISTEQRTSLLDSEWGNTPLGKLFSEDLILKNASKWGNTPLGEGFSDFNPENGGIDSG